MNDHFNHRRVQLVAIAYRRRAAFNVAYIAAFVGDQNGALELAGFFRVDAEIGRQLHRAAYAFRNIDKGPVGGHRRVECGKEVVVARHHGAEVFLHQFRVIVDRLAERTEDNPLLRQLFAIGGSDGNRVKNGIDRHFPPLAHRHAEEIERLFNFIGQKRAGARLLQSARLRGAGVIAVAAGGRRVIAVILIVQLVVVRLQPVRLFHRLPGLKRV